MIEFKPASGWEIFNDVMARFEVEVERLWQTEVSMTKENKFDVQMSGRMDLCCDDGIVVAQMDMTLCGATSAMLGRSTP